MQRIEKLLDEVQSHDSERICGSTSRTVQATQARIDERRLAETAKRGNPATPRSSPPGASSATM